MTRRTNPAKRPLDDARIARLYAEGYSLREIADFFDTSATNIRTHLLRMGVSRRPKVPRTHRKNMKTEVLVLYAEGLTLQAIANALGITTGTVRKHLRANNL